MKVYRAKRISDGHYTYRGFDIQRYPSCGVVPGWKFVWEATDEFGGGFAHAETLSACKKFIDEDLRK